MGRVGLDLRLSGHEPGARLAGVEGSPQAPHSSDFEGHPRAPKGTDAPVAAGSTPHPGALQTVYAGSIPWRRSVGLSPYVVK